MVVVRDQHPCMDLAKGERLLKDVYEALRASPKWDKTLFIVTYDDYGGFDDQIPEAPAPPDRSPCLVWNKEHGLPPTAPTVCPNPDSFNTTGKRGVAAIMSPWVGKGAIFQAPKKGPKPDSQYDHTAMLATAKEWFGLGGFLTDRDAWAGTFSELLLDAPRPDSDMPLHLPTAPEPATPWHPWPPQPKPPPPPPPPGPSPLPKGKKWQCVEDSLLTSSMPDWRVPALSLTGVDYTKGFSGDIASCQAVCNGACVKNGQGVGKAPCRALEFHVTDRHCVCYDGPKSFTFDELKATVVGHQKNGTWSTCMLTPPDPPGMRVAADFNATALENLTSSGGPHRRLAGKRETLLGGPQLDDLVTEPQHCSQSATPPGACLGGAHAVTQKQRNLMELYAALTQAPLPDIEGMGYVEADVWTRARWNEYMAMLP